MAAQPRPAEYQKGGQAGDHDALALVESIQTAISGVMSELTLHEQEAYQQSLEMLQLMAAQTGLSGENLPKSGTEQEKTATRKSAETKISKAELRYRALVERIPAVTFLAALDETRQELYVSPQIETLLGFSQEEWLSDPFLWYYRLHPDDREGWADEFARTCATGAQFKSEYRLIARDGRIVWIHGECQVIRDEEGRPVFLQGIAYDITDSKRAAEVLRRAHEDLEQRVRDRTMELAQSEARLRSILDTAVDGIITIDEKGIIGSFNPAATRIFGYAADEVIGRNVNILMPSPDHEAHDGYLKRYLGTGVPRIIGEGREVTGRRKNGGLFPMDLAVSETAIAGGRAFTGLVRDISARKRAEWLESDQREILEMVTQDLPVEELLHRFVQLIERQTEGCRAALLVIDAGEMQFCAPNLPVPFVEAMRSKALTLAGPLSEDARRSGNGIGVTDMTSDACWTEFRSAAEFSEKQLCWSVPLDCSDGTPLGMIAIFSTPHHPPGDTEIKMLQLVSKLATLSIEHHQKARQLLHLARHDPLTGLPNRIMFEDRLQNALALAQRSGNYVAVLVMDIDKFKNINDTMGHQCGDQLLQQFAQRLRARLRATDTMGRLGGDEFMIVLPELANRDSAANVAQKLVSEMASPFQLSDRTLGATCSIGLAVFPEDGNDALSLQKRADEALYRVKARGRNGFSF